MMVAKKYTDRNGDTKTQWVKIGSVVDNGVGDDGKRKLFGNVDTIPTFEWDGSVNLFEQEEQNQGGNNQGYQQQNQQQQQYQPPVQEYRNAQNQLTDANGNLLLDGNGQPRY